jgi:hypothetical protein
MATAKKVAAKAALKKIAKKLVMEYIPLNKTVKREQTFDMPVEVRDWIEQASSRLKSMQSKIERLELENKELKSYKRWAEHKIVGTSSE